MACESYLWTAPENNVNAFPPKKTNKTPSQPDSQIKCFCYFYLSYQLCPPDPAFPQSWGHQRLTLTSYHTPSPFLQPLPSWGRKGKSCLQRSWQLWLLLRETGLFNHWIDTICSLTWPSDFWSEEWSENHEIAWVLSHWMQFEGKVGDTNKIAIWLHSSSPGFLWCCLPFLNIYSLGRELCRDRGSIGASLTHTFNVETQHVRLDRKL